MKNKAASKVRFTKYDTLWAKLVRDRDQVCQVPLCAYTSLSAHHIEGRAKKSTRLMLENGLSLCSWHHVFNSDFSAHRTPKDFKDWFRKEFPERWANIQEKVRLPMSEKKAIEEFKLMLQDDLDHQ